MKKIFVSHPFTGNEKQNRSDAAGIVADHTANGRGCARIRWEKKTFTGKYSVELLVNDSGLDVSLEVFGTDGEDLIHFTKIDDHPAPHRNRIAFQAGARSPSGDRNFIPAGPLDKEADFFRSTRPHDNIRQRCRVERFIMGMQGENRLPCGNPLVVEHAFQFA